MEACSMLESDGPNPLKNDYCPVFAGVKDIALADSGKMAVGGWGSAGVSKAGGGGASRHNLPTPFPGM